MAESCDGSYDPGSQSDDSHHFERLRVEPIYDAFVCPLTKQVMRDPVALENGQTFEREAIEKWFRECKESGRNLVCPLTEKELKSTDLNPSIALRNTIEEWTARNEAVQIDMACRSLNLGSPESDVMHSLKYIQYMCHKSRSNKHVVRNADLIPMIIEMLKSTSRRVRCKALETLQTVVEDDADNKAILAEGDTVRTIVKFLSHEPSIEREEAVSLLLELSKSEALCEKIGSINGAILILVGMTSSKSENLSTVEKADKTLENLEKCENNVRQMAENGRLQPLLYQILEEQAELLGKKYEEKYKQVAEVASKLTIEEAFFRDIQERKLELRQAITNMEHGGSADGILQVRADRIQSDLDELLKGLAECCKKHGLDVKSTAVIELPFGWQAGIQEGAATWDEDWDKFEDEGFSNELTVDVKRAPGQKERAPADGSLTPDSLSNGDMRSGIFTGEHVRSESESAYIHSEDEIARSPQGSPAGRSASESPSQDFSDVFTKNTEADIDTHRSFDESTWGAFDTNDDVDSVWGFNPAGNKDSSENERDFFGSDDFGLKPIRTESTSTANTVQKKSIFFEESVAGSPMSRFGNSPRYSEAGDHFDNYSRFDSFSMNEGGFSPREKLTRFDSINSSKDFGHSRAFSSFDDGDPFGTSAPFKVSSEDQTPKKSSGNWSSF